MVQRDSLMHFGVLGMKWGVRKDATSAFMKDSVKGYKLQKKKANADYKLAKQLKREYSLARSNNKEYEASSRVVQLGKKSATSK